MTPEHLAILHAALDAAYAAEAAKAAFWAARKADNAAREARIAKCCALDEDGIVNGIIFTTYAGEELVEQYTLTRQEFDDIIRDDIALGQQVIRDEIAGRHEDGDSLFSRIAALHFESFDSEYSQKDWYEQMKVYIEACEVMDD